MSTNARAGLWVRTSERSVGARRAGSTAAPLVGESNPETQAYGRLVPMPLALAESARRQGVEHLNQLLADLINLRDLYKKHHWQASGPTFYPLHLLFDRHAEQLTEAIDQVAERVMTLGGVAVAMAADVAEMTLIPRPPKGREDAPSQLWRLLHAHEIVLEEARAMARASAAADDVGTNDLLVTDVIRRNEEQAWFLSEHLVDSPLLPTARTVANNGKGSRPGPHS